MAELNRCQDEFKSVFDSVNNSYNQQLEQLKEEHLCETDTLTKKITCFEDIIRVQEKMFDAAENCSQKNISSLEAKLQNMTEKYRKDKYHSREQKKSL